MTSIFEQYALLEAQEKEIAAKKEMLRPAILQKMIDDGIEKLDTSVGKFSITRLKQWTYPEHVQQLGEDFKEAKAKSESTGEATYTEKESLRFTIIKL